MRTVMFRPIPRWLVRCGRWCRQWSAWAMWRQTGTGCFTSERALSCLLIGTKCRGIRTIGRGPMLSTRWGPNFSRWTDTRWRRFDRSRRWQNRSRPTRSWGNDPTTFFWRFYRGCYFRLLCWASRWILIRQLPSREIFKRQTTFSLFCSWCYFGFWGSWRRSNRLP